MCTQYRRINQRGWVLWRRLPSRTTSSVFLGCSAAAARRRLKEGTAAAEDLGVSPQTPKLRPLWDCGSLCCERTDRAEVQKPTPCCTSGPFPLDRLVESLSCPSVSLQLTRGVDPAGPSSVDSCVGDTGPTVWATNPSPLRYRT